MQSIVFFFDFTSPFSYLTFESLLKDRVLLDQMEFCPVVVGVLISSVGGVGPGQIKSKREYLFKDCLRRAQKLEITLKCPASLPFSPLSLLRMVIALKDNKPDQLKLVTSIFRYGWLHGNDYENFDKFKNYIKAELDYSEEQYLALETNREARKSLKANNVEAVASGVFGVPSFLVEKEVFWGLDSLEHLKSHMRDSSKSIEREFKRFVNILEGESND